MIASDYSGNAALPSVNVGGYYENHGTLVRVLGWVDPDSCGGIPHVRVVIADLRGGCGQVYAVEPRHLEPLAAS
jgi:hypothetical protein